MDRLSHHYEHSYFAKCIGLHSFQIMVHQSAFNHLQHETIIILILRFDLCVSCLQTCMWYFHWNRAPQALYGVS